MRNSPILALFVAIVAAESFAYASTNETDERSEILFTRRIAPLIREKCIACHGSDAAEIEGGLDMTSAASLLEGGDSDVPGVIAGKPAESPIYLAAERFEEEYSAMPPKEAEKLTPEQLDWLSEWIQTGAAWPSASRQEELQQAYATQWSAEDGIEVITSGGLSEEWTHRKYDPDGLWAYQPVRAVDELAGNSPSQTIDRLIFDAMPAGLEVAPAASRRDLIRRATFDLTGLPPTPAEILAFVNDERSNDLAFAAVVDRLLESPHYGERMAQHWLDVVRYADSSGFANDYERGNAWRYRDYVIRAFNNDKPYDQFIREQISGDELAPDDPEGLIAVGFLRMGPWELTGMEVERVARQRFLDDVTNSVGETFLGHSLQCARCHDHKFDPVPTRDYYSIQAVFATTQLTERRADFLEVENRRGFEEKRFLKLAQQANNATRQHLQQVLLDNADRWFMDRLDEAKGETRAQIESQKKRWDDAVQAAKDKQRSGIFGAVRNDFVRQGIPQEEFPPQLVGFTPYQHGIYRVASKGNQRMAWELERYQPYALSVYSGYTPTLVRVHSPLRMPKNAKLGDLEKGVIRTGGDPFAEGQEVQPGGLSVLAERVPFDIPTTVSGRRTKLADWIANADNSLTTRVIVNRVWQWHFGRGLASNPNNFGATGGRPTHPELLDYLAAKFVEDGWSFKSLHRHVMLSECYRRAASHPNPALVAELDPLATSHAVFRPRRLSAEELRDSMLAVTGELTRSVGGIPCRPEINNEVATQPRQVMGSFANAWVPNPEPAQRHRRSIYVLKLRGVLHPMLEVFNSPAPDFSCERRESSTVTPQVFTLFNSQDSYARGLALANRAWQDTKTMEQARRDQATLQRCVELSLGRRANDEELRELLDHWAQLESKLPENPRPDPRVPLTVKREAVEENTGERFVFEERLFANEEFVPDLLPSDVDHHIRALADICLVLLNSNEFVYVY